MRLWHKELIPVLPRQQLLAQWRELCCIARNISVNGTPNHILVNKVLEYDKSDLYSYSILVSTEMKYRGYKVDRSKFEKYCYSDHFTSNPFKKWHNDRYFWQCYYNLEEKFDCGGISKEEFDPIRELMLKKYEEEFHETVWDCIWTKHPSSSINYTTSCGEDYVPMMRGYTYCPYCGKKKRVEECK